MLELAWFQRLVAGRELVESAECSSVSLFLGGGAILGGCN